MGKKLINDPVHGMIEIPDYAKPVIATPLFQRLGRVKQLGCLEKVWPSAVHTRLEHSIGTMHLAIVYANILNFSDYEKMIFALASLLHDISHGPFSHVFEKAIAGTVISEKFKNHDYYREHLIKENPELSKALGKTVIQDILHVWNNTFSENSRIKSYKVLYTLLAGDAGVDRMDYIVRDSYHTTPQRRLDSTCFQSIMHHTEIDWKRGEVHFTEKGVKYVSNLLNERAYLYKEVYLHRRTIEIEAILSRAFTKGLAQDIYPFIDPVKFEQLDDSFIVSCAWNGKEYSSLVLEFIRSNGFKSC